MNEYVEILKRYMAENPPNYGSDAQSILEMLFVYYHECNNTDTDAVKAGFEDLYQRMHGYIYKILHILEVSQGQSPAKIKETYVDCFLNAQPEKTRCNRL